MPRIKPPSIMPGPGRYSDGGIPVDPETAMLISNRCSSQLNNPTATDFGSDGRPSGAPPGTIMSPVSSSLMDHFAKKQTTNTLSMSTKNADNIYYKRQKRASRHDKTTISSQQQLKNASAHKAPASQARLNHLNSDIEQSDYDLSHVNKPESTTTRQPQHRGGMRNTLTKSNQVMATS